MFWGGIQITVILILLSKARMCRKKNLGLASSYDRHNIRIHIITYVFKYMYPRLLCQSTGKITILFSIFYFLFCFPSCALFYRKKNHNFQEKITCFSFWNLSWIMFANLQMCLSFASRAQSPSSSWSATIFATRR